MEKGGQEWMEEEEEGGQEWMEEEEEGGQEWMEGGQEWKEGRAKEHMYTSLPNTYKNRYLYIDVAHCT